MKIIIHSSAVKQNPVFPFLANLSSCTVRSARSRNPKKKKKNIRERLVGSEGFLIYVLITVFHFCWRPRSICCASRARRAPPRSVQHPIKGELVFCVWGFIQSGDTTFHMHKYAFGADKMENSSFSWFNRPLPAAAWQPFSTVYLLVGNNIDIHQCSHEGTKRSHTKDSGSTGVRRQGFSETCLLQWLLLQIWGQARHLKFYRQRLLSSHRMGCMFSPESPFSIRPQTTRANPVASSLSVPSGLLISIDPPAWVRIASTLDCETLSADIHPIPVPPVPSILGNLWLCILLQELPTYWRAFLASLTMKSSGSFKKQLHGFDVKNECTSNWRKLF